MLAGRFFLSGITMVLVVALRWFKSTLKRDVSDFLIPFKNNCKALDIHLDDIQKL